ncbi:MAG: hypothetical protein ACI9DF_001819 [Verrucomicrobiales bacterium]|jgi:hypothetical protein
MKMPATKYSRTFPRAGRVVKIMLLSILLWVCVIGLPYTLFRTMFEGDPAQQRLWAVGALACLVLGSLIRLLIYLIGSKIRCPLCQGAAFQTARCRMNQNARKYPVLSYSTTMVLDMMIYRRFVCKYCGTPFRLKK